MAKGNRETRIRNAKNLSKILKAIPDDVQNQVKKSMSRAVERVAKKADAEAPVLTGSLAASINATNIDNDDFRWGILANFYWNWVEFGTKKTPAQPFFMVHWRKAKKTVKNSIRRNVKKKLREKYGR